MVGSTARSLEEEVEDDFKPVLCELLATHPGLEFLQSTPKFQERYGLSSILVITLHLGVISGNGRLTLRELKCQNIIDVMLHADEEEDINKDESYITLRDLKGSKLSVSVFNILVNLNKFMAFETRDPFLIHQERENPTLAEWDALLVENILGFQWKKM
ncbi:hypothetical protein JHK87_034140 [Glycine soja]|nr:hypothetical protein JHK87_034140 [Glycine soja]